MLISDDRERATIPECANNGINYFGSLCWRGRHCAAHRSNGKALPRLQSLGSLKILVKRLETLQEYLCSLLKLLSPLCHPCLPISSYLFGFPYASSKRVRSNFRQEEFSTRFYSSFAALFWLHKSVQCLSCTFLTAPGRCLESRENLNVIFVCASGGERLSPIFNRAEI